MNKLSSLPRPTFPQVVTFLIACVAVFLLVNLSQRWLIARDELARKRTLIEAVVSVQAQRDELRDKLTEPEIQAALERAAQEDLGLVADGEGSVLLLYPDDMPESEPPPPQDAGAQTPPYWTEWATLFQ